VARTREARRRMGGSQTAALISPFNLLGLHKAVLTELDVVGG
jgi:hypothetical protein